MATDGSSSTDLEKQQSPSQPVDKHEPAEEYVLSGVQSNVSPSHQFSLPQISTDLYPEGIHQTGPSRWRRPRSNGHQRFFHEQDLPRVDHVDDANENEKGAPRTRKDPRERPR